MFLVPTKTVVIEATKEVFDDEFPEADFRDIWVSMEYPLQRASYPGIWVDFSPSSDVQTAGIGHYELSAPGANGERRKLHRWRFAGMLSFTCVALTSFERDRLVDSLIRVMAFGLEEPATSEWRSYIEHNDLVGLNPQYDKFSISGVDANQGTPWGTDEIIYEATLTVDCIGEFLSDGSSGVMVPLSAIVVTEWRSNDQTDPTTDDQGPITDQGLLVSDRDDLTKWH